jgi:hypothetical protein
MRLSFYGEKRQWAEDRFGAAWARFEADFGEDAADLTRRLTLDLCERAFLEQTAKVQDRIDLGSVEMAEEAEAQARLILCSFAVKAAGIAKA